MEVMRACFMAHVTPECSERLAARGMALLQEQWCQFGEPPSSKREKTLGFTPALTLFRTLNDKPAKGPTPNAMPRLATQGNLGPKP